MPQSFSLCSVYALTVDLANQGPVSPSHQYPDAGNQITFISLPNQLLLNQSNLPPGQCELIISFRKFDELVFIVSQSDKQSIKK